MLLGHKDRVGQTDVGYSLPDQILIKTGQQLKAVVAVLDVFCVLLTVKRR